MTDDFEKDYDSSVAVSPRERARDEDGADHRGGRVQHRAVGRGPGPGLPVHQQPRTNAQITTPEIDKNQVTVTMQKVGDEWLVDDLKTTRR